MPAGLIADFLRAGTMLAPLPAEEILALAAVAREDTCLVRSGRLKILRQSRGGKEVAP